MTSTSKNARIAGLLYLLLVGPLRMLIPSTLFVHGNASATANNITAHEVLFRSGIVAELADAIVLILLTLAFYRLFFGTKFRNLQEIAVAFSRFELLRKEER